MYGKSQGAKAIAGKQKMGFIMGRTSTLLNMSLLKELKVKFSHLFILKLLSSFSYIDSMIKCAIEGKERSKKMGTYTHTSMCV